MKGCLKSPWEGALSQAPDQYHRGDEIGLGEENTNIHGINFISA